MKILFLITVAVTVISLSGCPSQKKDESDLTGKQSDQSESRSQDWESVMPKKKTTTFPAIPEKQLMNLPQKKLSDRVEESSQQTRQLAEKSMVEYAELLGLDMKAPAGERPTIGRPFPLLFIGLNELKAEAPKNGAPGSRLQDWLRRDFVSIVYPIMSAEIKDAPGKKKKDPASRIISSVTFNRDDNGEWAPSAFGGVNHVNLYYRIWNDKVEKSKISQESSFILTVPALGREYLTFDSGDDYRMIPLADDVQLDFKQGQILPVNVVFEGLRRIALKTTGEAPGS